MRYDTPVLFVIEKNEYNYTTHNTDIVALVSCELANVTDTTAQTMTLMYGGIKNHAKTVIVQGRVTTPSYIVIGNRKYKIDRERHIRTGSTFWISGGTEWQKSELP